MKQFWTNVTWSYSLLIMSFKAVKNIPRTAIFSASGKQSDSAEVVEDYLSHQPVS